MRPFQTDSSPEDDFMSDADVLEAAGELVEAFLSAIRDQVPRHDILDTDLLPSSKDSMVNGFRLVIVTESRENVRRRLVAAGKVLAQFQDDVGARIVLRPASENSKQATAGSAAALHIEQLLISLEMDQKRLAELFEDADRTAARRFAVKVPPGFREDGTYTWHGHQRPH